MSSSTTRWHLWVKQRRWQAGLAWWACAQGPTLGFCCHCLEILHNFWIFEQVHFHFALDSESLVMGLSQSRPVPFMPLLLRDCRSHPFLRSFLREGLWNLFLWIPEDPGTVSRLGKPPHPLAPLILVWRHSQRWIPPQLLPQRSSHSRKWRSLYIHKQRWIDMARARNRKVDVLGVWGRICRDFIYWTFTTFVCGLFL